MKAGHLPFPRELSASTGRSSREGLGVSQPRRSTGETFVSNHAHGIAACDFLVAVTARFQLLYVFLMMEVGTRRIVHYNLTAHPTANGTLQQFWEATPSTRPDGLSP